MLPVCPDNYRDGKNLRSHRAIGIDHIVQNSKHFCFSWCFNQSHTERLEIVNTFKVVGIVSAHFEYT